MDPLNAFSWENLGEIEFYREKLDEAAVDAKKARELNSDYQFSHALLSEIYIIEGRPSDALPEIERLRYPFIRACVDAIAFHALGREKKSDIALRDLIAKYHEGGAFQIA